MKENRNKVHLHLNIRKDFHTFLKEQKINASMFFENAVMKLKNGLNADSAAEEKRVWRKKVVGVGQSTCVSRRIIHPLFLTSAERQPGWHKYIICDSV